MSSRILHLPKPLGVRLAVLFASVGVAAISACNPDRPFPTGPHVVRVMQPHATVIGATVVILPTLGGPSTFAYGINDVGQVTGWSATAERAEHAFRWTPGQGIQDLGTLGGTNSRASSINDAGQVVGWSATVGDVTQHAFLWTPGRGMQDLGTLGGERSFAQGVNESGSVVGYSQTASNAVHAFLWTPAAGMQDLGNLNPSSPSTWAFANGINDAAQVVGEVQVAAGVFHAFLWTQADGMQDLGTLGGPRSDATAINNAGQVTGYSTSAAGQTRAFLWTPGQGMQDLGTVGGRQTTVAYGMNDAGEVVGYADNGATITAFFWSAADGMEDLYAATGLPEANAINNHGQVVGYDRVVTLQFANRAPIAIPGGPYTGQKKKPVAFDGSRSSDRDGDLLTYVWDFGDGSPSASGPTPIHEYLDWGTYTVRLTVSDPAGLSAAQTTTATIAPPGHLKHQP